MGNGQPEPAASMRLHTNELLINEELPNEMLANSSVSPIARPYGSMVTLA